METLRVMYPMFVGTVLNPVVAKLKTLIGPATPLVWYLVSLALNAIAIFGIAYFMNPEMPIMGLEVLGQFLMAQVATQATHAVVKTKKKLLIGAE